MPQRSAHSESEKAMIRRTKGSKILPLAVTAALAGTSWIGLAGGFAPPPAEAQRTQDKEKEDQDRRQRERQRQERPPARQQDRSNRGAPGEAPQSGRPADRAAPTRPEFRQEPPRAMQPERRDRVAPIPPPNQPRTTSPQQQPQQPPQKFQPQPQRPDFGRAPPPPPGGTTNPPPQRQVLPPRAPDRPDTGPDRGRFGQPQQRELQREGRPTDGPRPIPGAPTTSSGDGRERSQRFGPARLDEVKRGRVERVEDGRRVIEEPGNRVIIRDKDRMVIRRDEGRAFERYSTNARTRDVGEGRRETWFERPDGTRVYTEVDRNGRILRRWRRDRGGREIVLIDNRRFYRNVGIGIGIGALGVGVALALAPPAIGIPRERYIVDYERASDDDLYEALSAPPVGRLERGYSLDEIRYSASLRDYMRRIDLDMINFEFGSFEVARDQYPKLARLARIIQRMLDRNEAEVLLIEGHTDAVGSDEDNLTLSDRRADAVADILVNEFGIPPENLVTQGYGEQFLKVNTLAAERVNRRVAVRRITPLLGEFRDR